MIRYTCPKCKTELESSHAMAGQMDKCPMCNNAVRVPLPNPKPKRHRKPKRLPPSPSPVPLPAPLPQGLWPLCPACKERINPDADICPHCRTKRPLTGGMTTAGWAAIVAVVLLGLVYIGWPSLERTPTWTKTAAQMEEGVVRMMESGGVHSVDVAANTVRVNALTWSLMKIEMKRDLVAFFSQYFEMKRGYERVTVLSDRNDTKLATYGPWGGIKILK